MKVYMNMNTHNWVLWVVIFWIHSLPNHDWFFLQNFLGSFNTSYIRPTSFMKLSFIYSCSCYGSSKMYFQKTQFCASLHIALTCTRSLSSEGKGYRAKRCHKQFVQTFVEEADKVTKCLGSLYFWREGTFKYCPEVIFVHVRRYLSSEAGFLSRNSTGSIHTQEN